jgi:hypothetical protein
MLLDQPRYRISEVARAAGVEPNTIRSWFQRGHLWLIETDKRSEGNGMAHLLSLRSALRIAAMGELVALGVQPRNAGIAATLWTDTGDEFRDPGALFSDPLTVLCVFGDGSSAVVHSPLGTGKAFDLFWSAASGSHSSVCAVLLDNIDRKVRSALADGEG